MKTTINRKVDLMWADHPCAKIATTLAPHLQNQII